jgi:ribosomal protein L11 methyltransferase
MAVIWWIPRSFIGEFRNVFLWRKITTPRWIESHSAEIDAIPPERVAIIHRAGFKRMLLEIACESGRQAKQLRARNGGEIKRLEKNWLQRFARAQVRKPLRIGKRLIVYDSERSRRTSAERAVPSLIVPSGAAFGTGDHPTTAMTLRLLEGETHKMKSGWSVADLGTGTGILALAARRLGARRIEAVDFDPSAISTAKENARGNGIRGINFSVEDVKEWRPGSKLDAITANLFSQLLISVLPRVRKSLKAGGFFIFSGVMRSEELSLLKAIRKNKLQLRQIRRRGKWISCSGGFKTRARTEESVLRYG